MVATPFLRLNLRLPSYEANKTRLLTEVLRRELSSHAFPEGLRLPPVRVLQHQLGLGKNTVHAAYEELAAQGVIINKPREGYYVAAKTDDVVSASNAAAPPVELLETSPPPFSAARGNHVSSEVIGLSNVFIDRELLPFARLEDCVRSVLRQTSLHGGMSMSAFFLIESRDPFDSATADTSAMLAKALVADGHSVTLMAAHDLVWR